MTAFDLEKSFSLNVAFKIIGTYAFWFTRKYILANICYISKVWDLERFQTAKVTGKVTEVIDVGTVG